MEAHGAADDPAPMRADGADEQQMTGGYGTQKTASSYNTWTFIHRGSAQPATDPTAIKEHLIKMESEFRATNPAPSTKSATSAEPRTLPAALQARLAKRGILPQATISAPPTATKKPASAPRLPPKPLPAPADLQPGWRCALDPAHERVYYYNLSTGVRTWIKPSTGPPLPPGWVEVQDANTGGSYFCSAHVGQSQWLHPLISKSSAAAAAPVGGGAGFIPSSSFAGQRAGYVFKSGPQGVGYYADGAPVAAAARGPRAQQQGGRWRGEGWSATDELDPMDPAAYSDAPRGGWSRGLEVR